MKTRKPFLTKVFTFAITLVLVIFIFLITSFDIGPNEESQYSAILMTRPDLEKSIRYQPSEPIREIGKIYKKDSWIFITEKYKGIHIIDNTNYAAPVNAGFIQVPGCIDISMKNNFLYADNSVDLITIDVNTLPEIKVTSRIKDVFPEPLPPDLQYIPAKFSKNNRPANTIIVEWKKIH